MKAARLHTIYAQLLAHCFELRPEDERKIRRHWDFTSDQIFGAFVEKLITPTVQREFIRQVRKDYCREHLEAGMWFCVDHRWPQCDACRLAVGNRLFARGLERLPFAEYLQARVPEFLEENRPRPIKICSMPSPLLQQIAANELAQHFDLAGVPGFYQAGATTQTADPLDIHSWVEAALGKWRLNLPFKAGLLVPYYHAGLIVGIRVFRNVQDQRPLVLTSRGLRAGAKAVAFAKAVAA